MKIVVLDGYALNPGDLSWDAFSKIADLKVFDRTKTEDLYLNGKDAEVILTNKVPLNAQVLAQLPNLKYIGVLATGYNIIDIAYAKERGIVVTNIPDYSTPSVVQMTFALLLELCLHAQRHSDAVFSGKWSRALDFCFWDYPLVELAGKTMGIIGFGNIGKQVADVASAFGMQVVANSRTQTDQSHRKNFQWASLEQLLSMADVVSLHTPLTPQTKGIINSANLKLMKPTAFLINTSRGPLIVEEDLAAALNAGELAGAGLDVLSQEPPLTDNPLFQAQNCLITPHIAWASKEARERLMQIATDNLTAFLSGHPVNVVG